MTITLSLGKGTGLVLLLAALAGCSNGWFGAAEEPPLPGERVPVLLYDGELAPDPAVAGRSIELPPPYRNTNWSQASGGPLHALGHLEGPTVLKSPAWTVDIGSGAGWYRPLLSAPVISGGRIYTMDAAFEVTAFDAAKGKRLWRTGITPKSRDSEAFGGGLAYDGGRVYVATGAAEVAALDAETGKILWRQPLPGPVHGAPLVLGGQLFLVSLDNQLVALDAATGTGQWRHAGFSETAALLGGAAPAGTGGTVIAPYSSGEIYAIRTANGRPTWSESLAAVRSVDATAGLGDIVANPVTDGNTVYAVSHSGRSVAIDMRTGARIWERNIGGVQTPWLAGDWLFMVTNEAQLVALTRRDGRVRWIMQLDRYGNPDAKSSPIHWVGPLLVSGTLLVFDDHGKAVAVDPADGKTIASYDIRDGVMAAAVADGTLYLQTEDADLIAYR